MNGIFEGASKVVSISSDDTIAGSGHSMGRSQETSVWSDMTGSWKTVTGEGVVTTSLSRSDIIQRVPGRVLRFMMTIASLIEFEKDLCVFKPQPLRQLDHKRC